MKRKVKLTTAVAGEELVSKPGDIVELDAEVAQAWIAADMCVPVDEPAPAKKSK